MACSREGSVLHDDNNFHDPKPRTDFTMLLIVAMAWMYVVLMMSVAEAMAPDGGWLGALFTLLLYGVLPLSLALYLLATPARRRRRRAAEAAATSAQPDGRDHAATDPVAAERKEP
jgi:membrane protein implicated in regulation of membrane protease activity